MMSMLLTLLFTCLALLGLGEFGLSVHVSNHCEGLRRNFSEIRTELDVVPSSDQSRNLASHTTPNEGP
jgi:hypothetical protein